MNKIEIENLLKCLGFNCSQTQAAAFAVLASAVRRDIAKEYNDPQFDRKSVENVEMFLKLLEDVMVDSIRENDGEVAENIGHAARQMHPLL